MSGLRTLQPQPFADTVPANPGNEKCPQVTFGGTEFDIRTGAPGLRTDPDQRIAAGQVVRQGRLAPLQDGAEYFPKAAAFAGFSVRACRDVSVAAIYLLPARLDLTQPIQRQPVQKFDIGKRQRPGDKKHYGAQAVRLVTGVASAAA